MQQQSRKIRTQSLGRVVTIPSEPLLFFGEADNVSLHKRMKGEETRAYGTVKAEGYSKMSACCRLRAKAISGKRRSKQIMEPILPTAVLKGARIDEPGSMIALSFMMGPPSI